MLFCRLIENRFRWRLRSLVDVTSRVITDAPSLGTGSARSESRSGLAGSPGWRIRLPYTGITRLRSIGLVVNLRRYDSATRLPEGHLRRIIAIAMTATKASAAPVGSGTVAA